MYFSNKNSDCKDAIEKVKVADRKLPWVATAVHVGNSLHEDGTMNQDIKVKRAQFINKSVELNQEFFFATSRTKFEVNQIYNNHYQDSFQVLIDQDKLRFLLFPFQDELNDASIRNNKKLQKDMLNKRIRIIRCLMNFVNSTNRFNEYVDKSYFTF